MATLPASLCAFVLPFRLDFTLTVLVVPELPCWELPASLAGRGGGGGGVRSLFGSGFGLFFTSGSAGCSTS